MSQQQQRAPTPPTKAGGSSSSSSGGGGGGSRNNTPVLARYTVLQQRQQQQQPTMEPVVAVPTGGILPTVVHAASAGSVSVSMVTVVPAAAVLGGAAAAATVATSTTSTTTHATATAAALVTSSSGLVGGGPEEPRSSTPARLSRVLSPLKGRATRAYTPLGPSSLAAAHREHYQQQQAQAQAAAEAEAARRRIERRSRRKLRRWANDRLVAVAQLAPGAAHLLDQETGELVGGNTTGGAFAFFDATDPHPTHFTTLMAAEHQEVRDRFLQGYYGAAPPRRHHRHRHHGHGQEGGAGGGGGGASRPRTALQEAEARFLRLERRLRGILTQIVAGDVNMEAFLTDVETLLRAFVQGDPLPAATDDAAALGRTLLAPIRIDAEKSKDSSSKSPQQTLVLPLRNSAFLRLIVHGCAQYYGLKSRSEDMGADCRAVLVTRGGGGGASAGGANLGMTMRGFIRHSRLEQGRLKAGSKRGGQGRRLGGAEEEEEAEEGVEGGAPVAAGLDA